MDEFTQSIGESALDLSVLPDYNSCSADISQLSSSHIVMLPASAITISDSNNIPFYISPTGKWTAFPAHFLVYSYFVFAIRQVS